MIAALLAATLSGQLPRIEPPSHTFTGPMRLCGQFFALQVGAGTRVRWEGQIDFDIYQVEGRDGGWSFYEGFAPDADSDVREAVTLPDGRIVQRLRSGDGEIGYLIRTVMDPQPYFVHVVGSALRGDAADLGRLAHFTFGAPAQTGCREPSRERYRLRWWNNLR